MSKIKENKFRAWNIEKKIMCYDNEDNCDEYWDGVFSSEVGLINRYLNLPNNIKTYVYMQYIGKTDKNKKEIYEGDIVKEFADCNELGESLYYFYQIRWNEEYCAFEGYDIYGEETFLLSDLHFEDIEVIGNIYDNPELLGSTYYKIDNLKSTKKNLENYLSRL